MSKKNLLFILLMVMSLTIYSQETAIEIEPSGEVSVKTKLKDSSGATYDALPIGTILMFSGKNWQDNVTLKGWVACTTETNGNIKVVEGMEIPNLESSFIMGTTPEDLNQTSPIRTGGKNELEARDLPKHAHNIDHDHPAFDIGEGAHQHRTYIASDRYGAGNMATYIDNMGNTAANDEGYVPFYTDLGSASYNGSHTHTVDVKSFASNTAVSKFIDDNSNKDYTSGPVGDNLKMDNRPKYYTVIYIMKVKY